MSKSVKLNTSEASAGVRVMSHTHEKNRVAAASQPNWTDAQVAAITVPTQVVVGQYDEAILPAHSEKIAGLIPGAKLVILPDDSHFAMLQAPAEYNAAVRAFIDQ